MSDDAARAKWDELYRDADCAAAVPCALLTEFDYLLPAQGSALDIACGAGGNALHLARRGLRTTAVDISAVALRRLAEYARQQALDVRTVAADLTVDVLPAGPYDAIVISHYLERGLAPAIKAALRPGGLLFYQTFVQEVIGDSGPKNPRFRLAPNELLTLFGGLHVIYFRDEGRVGDVNRGLRNSAQLIAQRR